MHSINFYCTVDFAWIEETNMNPYEDVKETLTKDKKSKTTLHTLEEIKTYIKYAQCGFNVLAHVTVCLP